MTHSALYPGEVMHSRLRPRSHRLDYRIYSLLIDLDELETLGRRLKLFSVNRFNLFSFREKDYGDGSDTPLRPRIDALLDRAGFEYARGPVRLLTMPRILGWAFNPLSVFFCHDQAGTLRAVLWQVDNTFGERHSYLIPVEDGSGEPIRQSCDKAFYVSPFMAMALRYRFTLTPPGERLAIVIAASDAQGLLLSARHTATRQPLTDATLMRAFFAIPFLTLKVVAGIHWEALRLWWKGVRLVDRPAPPESEISVITSDTKSQGAGHE